MRWKSPFLWCFLLWAAPVMSQAQFNYLTNGSTITITGYTGPGGAVVIPTNISGLTVTAVGDFAFSNSFNLTNVEIPGSVGSIGVGAFADCDSLTNATIDPGVTNLDDYAFANCYSLASITIPSGIVSIGSFDFENTSLANITIPNTVTNIGTNAFSDTYLTSVAIPGSVISIGYGAFDPSPYLTNLTIGNGVANIEYAAFATCNLGDFTIPASVTNLEAFAFSENPMLSVYFASNAPAETEPLAFYADVSTTIYYLPNTSGWGATFSGLPTALWNPVIQTGDGKFGIQGNQFGFDITGTPDIPVLIEATTDLTSSVWMPLQYLTLTNGLYYFSEPQQIGRFYRISSY